MLSFSTGFEPNTSLNAVAPADCFGNGCWQSFLAGQQDLSTGSTWPPTVWGGNVTRIQQLADAPVDATTVRDYAFGQIVTLTGHRGTPTRALYQQVTQSGCCGQDPQGGGATQSAFQIQPGAEPGGTLGDIYISYWAKFQADLDKQLTPQNWRALFAWKSAGDYRVSVSVASWEDGCPGQPRSPNQLFWRFIGDSNANGNVPLETFWMIDNCAVAVPIGQWFKLEVFWHRGSSINDPSGRAWMAVNGQVVADVSSANLARVVCIPAPGVPSCSPNTSMRGRNNNSIDRIFFSSVYGGGPWPMYLWVDDLQIWERGFPLTCTDVPCAPH
jgi:hypothetical protein